MGEAATLDDIAPLDSPADKTQGFPAVDAPYGLKKDGTPAKKRGRQKGSTNTGTRASRISSKGSLRTEIGGLLVLVNLPLQMVPVLQQDALDASEIDALAKAIDQECQTNPRFRKYIEQMLRVQGGTNLMFVVAAIAARRVVRHGIVPEEIMEPVGGREGVDLIIGQAISASTNASIFKATVPPPTEPVTVEA